MKYIRDGGTEGPYALETYGYDAANGNLTSKAGAGIGYNTQAAGCPHGALSKEHAATSAGTNSYCYDPNGNMTRRTIGGVNYSMTYNAENRMTGMSGTGVNASFVYDGDGARVQGTVGGATVAYVGAHYEWSSAGNTRYYYAGLVRVAMRRASYAVDNGVFYLLGDHLGSTSVIANSSGGQHSEQMYKPWGEKRFPTGASALLTTYRFTGQRQESGLGPSGGEGLYYYGARWYDLYLGRFVQADTIVPGVDPKSWDRYSYVLNNPLRWVDPSGYKACEGDAEGPDDCDYDPQVKPPKKHKPNPWRRPAIFSAIGRNKTAGYNEDWDQLFLNHVKFPVGNGEHTGFGGCSTYTGCNGKFHPAIDTKPGAYTAGTPIYSMGYGKVVASGSEDYGYFVLIEHCITDGNCVYSSYAHLQEGSISVNIGDIVDSTTQIAGMGGSIDADSGGTTFVHLHLEVRRASNVYLTNPNGPFSSGYISGQYVEPKWWVMNRRELNTLFVDLGPLFGYDENEYILMPP
jgi:RHS repeat-associated protein